MQYSTTKDFGRSFSSILEILTNATTSDQKIVIFTTSIADCDKIRVKLEECLNKNKCKRDVVVIHGEQHKFEKNAFMKLFCDDIALQFFKPSVGIFNGAANTGFDLPSLTLVIRHGFPPDMLTLLQERGRLVRLVGSEGTFVIYGSIISFLHIQYLIHHPEKDPEQFDVAVFSQNSAINLKQRGDNLTRDRENEKYKPSIKARNGWRDLQIAQALDVLKYLCLDLGCKHAQAEHFSATGVFEAAPDSIIACNTKCPSCNKAQWKEQFRPVFKVDLISFLESELFMHAMPLPATYNHNGDSLTNLLWSSEEWIFKVFGCEKGSTIKKYHVESLMLQLIAAEIIVLFVERKSKDMKWKLNRERVQRSNDENCNGEENQDESGDDDNEETSGNGDSNDYEDVLQPCYKNDTYWKGVHLYPARKKHPVRRKKKKKTKNKSAATSK